MSRHYIAVKHIDAVRAFAPKALVVFDTVDLHFLRTERQAELEGNALARASARAKRDEELTLIRKADVTLVVSPFEQTLLAELVPDARVLVLSTIHELYPPGKPFAEREGLVFIGGFQHPPNTDAVLWYAQEVLPHVRAALPGVETYIVGSKVPANVRALAAEDFVVTGYVPDVTPYFTGCRVSIAPLRYGAGVKGKINLAMSYGLPVVATTPSIEGMFLVPEQDVLVADDAEGVRRRDRAPVPRRGAVAAARGGRPREHPGAFLARRRAQRDHPPHRVRERERRGSAERPRRRPDAHALARAGTRDPTRRGRAFAPRASNLVCGRHRGTRREAVRRVREQRLGAQASRASRARSPPSRSPHAGSRRAPAAARARARMPACSSRRL